MARAEGAEAVRFVDAALQAFDLVLDLATRKQPLSEAIVRRLHEVVTAAQETYDAVTTDGRQSVRLPRGEHKVHPNHVVEPDGSAHAYAPPVAVPSEMHRLVTELAAADEWVEHPARLAAMSHHALVAIHPFADGNGRVARLLGSVYLLRAASVPLMIWSDQSVDYRRALKAADAGAPQPFVDFVFDRAIDAMNLMVDRLHGRSADRRSTEHRERRTAEERQLAAAERLLFVLDRELRQNGQRPRLGVTATVDSVGVTDVGPLSSYPHGDGRGLTMVADGRNATRDFVVMLPRSDRSVVDVVTDAPDGSRRFRVADLMPELRSSAVAQIVAFVARHANEVEAGLG